VSLKVAARSRSSLPSAFFEDRASIISNGDEMTAQNLFSIYLKEALALAQKSENELARELGYRLTTTIRLWLRGKTVPHAEELGRLAKALKTDPVEVALGWLIDQCPDLEGLLREDVLDHRGSVFPMSASYRDFAFRTGRIKPPLRGD
jgi:transcriptional regulator with XRE-family HTH domain